MHSICCFTGKNILGDFHKSTFAKIWNASDALVNGLFLPDIKALFKEMEDFEEYYTNYYKSTVDLVVQYLGDLSGSFQELENAVVSMIKGYPASKFFDELVRNTLMDVTLAKDNLIVLQQKMMNVSYLNLIKENSKNVESFHPLHFTVTSENCLDKMTDIVTELSGIEAALEDFQSPQLSNETRNETQLDLILQLTVQYFKGYHKILECLEEYPGALKVVSTWVREMESFAATFTEGKPFDGVLYNYTEEAESLKEDENTLQELLYKYAHGKMTKLDYLKRFSKESQSAQVLSNLNKFINKIEKKLIDPLQERLGTAFVELQKNYVESMEKAAAFEQYLEKRRFYIPACRMNIWKIPSPNLENPKEFEFTETECWSVWGSNLATREFVKKDAQRLDRFCFYILFCIWLNIFQVTEC